LKFSLIKIFFLVHNHVNERLRYDVTEDPEHPKVQFPSKYLCQTCQSKNNLGFDISNTIEFLLKFYSKEEIETP